MKENLEKLLITLNQIEVKGEANLNRLLGSIQFIRGMINDMEFVSLSRNDPAGPKGDPGVPPKNIDASVE